MFGIEIDWMGLALPFAYLIVLSGSLMTFSSIYRKRKATQAANLEPWFGPHLQRNIYLSLLHMDPEKGDESAEKIPDNILKAALLRRAVEDINRLVQIRTAKQAISSLLQKGSVGDDLWQRFQRAEKEMESELRDVVMEANAMAPNWGQFIFQSANEIAVNVQFRKRLEEIQGKVGSEREWWEKRRAAIETELLGDDDADKSSTGKPASEDDAVLVDPGTPAATPAQVPASTTPAVTPAATPAKAPATPATPAANTPSGTPSGKKKKGKK
jgi:translocation protein SEC66